MTVDYVFDCRLPGVFNGDSFASAIITKFSCARPILYINNMKNRTLSSGNGFRGGGVGESRGVDPPLEDKSGYWFP